MKKVALIFFVGFLRSSRNYLYCVQEQFFATQKLFILRSSATQAARLNGASPHSHAFAWLIVRCFSLLRSRELTFGQSLHGGEPKGSGSSEKCLRTFYRPVFFLLVLNVGKEALYIDISGYKYL